MNLINCGFTACLHYIYYWFLTFRISHHAAPLQCSVRSVGKVEYILNAKSIDWRSHLELQTVSVLHDNVVWLEISFSISTNISLLYPHKYSSSVETLRFMAPLLQIRLTKFIHDHHIGLDTSCTRMHCNSEYDQIQLHLFPTLLHSHSRSKSIALITFNDI